MNSKSRRIWPILVFLILILFAFTGKAFPFPADVTDISVENCHHSG